MGMHQGDSYGVSSRTWAVALEPLAIAKIAPVKIVFMLQEKYPLGGISIKLLAELETEFDSPKNKVLLLLALKIENPFRFGFGAKIWTAEVPTVELFSPPFALGVGSIFAGRIAGAYSIIFLHPKVIKSIQPKA